MTLEMELLKRFAQFDSRTHRMFPEALPPHFELDVAHIGQRLVGSIEEQFEGGHHQVRIFWDDLRPQHLLQPEFERVLYHTGHEKHGPLDDVVQSGFLPSESSLPAFPFPDPTHYRTDHAQVHLVFMEGQVEMVWTRSLRPMQAAPTPLQAWIPRLEPPEHMMVLPEGSSGDGARMFFQARLLGDLPLEDVLIHYSKAMQDAGWTPRHRMLHSDEAFEGYALQNELHQFAGYIRVLQVQDALHAVLHLEHLNRPRGGWSFFTLQTEG